MKNYEMKEMILEFNDDITFLYDGEVCCINPWNENKFEVGFKDDVYTFSSIEDVMNKNIFNGKSLNQICENIVMI